MKLTLIRAMTRSAVFELENDLCFRPAEPFAVLLDGREIYAACNTNVFSVYSLLPGHPYTLTVKAGGEELTADFVTRTETFLWVVSGSSHRSPVRRAVPTYRPKNCTTCV